MKVEKSIKEKSVVELIVEADKKEVAKFRKKALDYLSKNTEIPGFRKGALIPENVLVKKV
jgi:FKBP-type peptidyl-prolyl cis-trans isomerase (trigger factor)